MYNNNGYNNYPPYNPQYETPLPVPTSSYQQPYMTFQQYREKNNLILEYATKAGKYICDPINNICYFEEYKATLHRKTNAQGVKVNTNKQSATHTDICSYIYISSAIHYHAEGSGKENFYIISYFSSPMAMMEIATIPESKYNSKTLYSSFKDLTPFPNQTAKTNEMLRLMVEARIKEQRSSTINIPPRCGWYGNKDRPYFISYNNYLSIEPSFLLEAILSYRLPQTENIELVIVKLTADYDPKPMQRIVALLLGTYFKSWQTKLLLTLRAASLFLFMFEQAGVRPKQFILPIISNSDQADYITSILKTHNPEVPSSISLNAGEDDIKKDLYCSQDGVAVIKALLDSKTISKCSSNLNTISNALNQAHTSDNDISTRQFIAIIARSLFETEYNEGVLPIDCSCIESDIDNSTLRKDLRLFDAALIEYIDVYYLAMSGYIEENYKHYADSSLSPERNSLLTIFKLSLDIFKRYLKTELFSYEELEKIDEMFLCDISDYKTNDQIVIEEFSSIVSKMIESNELTVIAKAKAKTQFKPNSNILIYNKADSLLSFEPDLIAWIVKNKMSTVKSRDELINTLKAQGKLRAVDHNGQHIRIPTEQNPNNKPFFYSIKTDLFGDIISESFGSENDNAYFMEPDEIPDRFFLPLVWNNSSAAGIVSDDLRNMNLHTLITGNSGKGKSYKMCRLAEYYHSIGAKVVFIDISGSFNKEHLEELHSNTNDYQIINVYKEGLPFDIFDLSTFSTSDEKKMYLQNVIQVMSAKELSPERKKELSARLQEITDANPVRTSFNAIIDEDSKSRRYALKNILEQFQTIFAHYSSTQINCNSYINNMDKINVISFGQIAESDISVIVFPLIESIFQHRVKDHRTPIVLMADEMQRYDELFQSNPLTKILNEGRRNNIIAIGSTHEYGGTGRKVSKIFSKANIQIFFQPTIDSLSRVKTAIGKALPLETIGNLDEYKCIVKSGFYNPKTKKNETTVLVGDSHSDTPIKNTKKYATLTEDETINTNTVTSPTICPTGAS